MAKNITAASATTITNSCRAILIQVNAALTGAILVTAGGSAQYGTSSQTIATITNPTVGSQFKYSGLSQQGAIIITPGAICDITVSVLNDIS